MFLPFLLTDYIKDPSHGEIKGMIVFVKQESDYSIICVFPIFVICSKEYRRSSSSRESGQ